jgi:uncharacterized damage-inducible protein DinB
MTPSPETTLIEFVRYDNWMNQQLLAICMDVDEGLLSAEIPGTYGSIRKTFSHLINSQAEFLERIHGTSPQPAFKWADKPSFAQMAEYADTLNEAFLDTIHSVPPTANVHEENETWSFDYHARLIFMSQIYHGIAHRTDITTFLNHHGIELPELDVWGYQEAYPDRFKAKLVRISDPSK